VIKHGAILAGAGFAAADLYRAAMPSRAATVDDVDDVARTITQAFVDDPVWGPALRRTDGRPIDLEPYWHLFVRGAMRFGTARIADDGAAVSIWLPPPAEPELSEEQLAKFEAFIERELDPRALGALRELFSRFEASRATRPAHYYLSLLATHPEHRSRGRGQILLAEDLVLWDRQGVPAYLESTNAGNNHRYERAGFRLDGGFPAVRDGTWISAMLRPVGG
jgi:GNAT superfamily N-acetyltransferase